MEEIIVPVAAVNDHNIVWAVTNVRVCESQYANVQVRKSTSPQSSVLAPFFSNSRALISSLLFSPFIILVLCYTVVVLNTRPNQTPLPADTQAVVQCSLSHLSLVSSCFHWVLSYCRPPHKLSHHFHHYQNQTVHNTHTGTLVYVWFSVVTSRISKGVSELCQLHNPHTLTWCWCSIYVLVLIVPFKHMSSQSLLNPYQLIT